MKHGLKYLFLGVSLVCLYFFLVKMTETYHDPDLMPYYHEWQRDLTTYGLDPNSADNIIIISFSDHMAMAEAGVSNRNHNTIYVNSDMADAGKYTVRAVLYHELGHYAFDLEHGSCTIMSDTVRDEDEYRLNWDQYVAEYMETIKKNNRQ